MFEPLFLFNYKTGALDPWLAKSSTPNALQDVWPLKVRADVKWSDSKPGRRGRSAGLADILEDGRMSWFTIDALAKFSTLLFPALIAVDAFGHAQAANRTDTVVFELSTPIDDPKNFNWFFPGVRRRQGAHQAMFEPLFLFNYRTGALEPWLAKSITPNATQDVWTLELRDDVKWSDGKPFTADDVQYTAETVLRSDFVPDAAEAVSFRSQVKSPIKVVTPHKVEFTLINPNPRFALDKFGGTMFGSFLIMPKHIWLKQDPTDFAFYTANFSTPVGTGPYKLKESDKTHTLWVRDDNWWGAQKGANGKPVFRPLPEPKELEWLFVDSANPADSKQKLVANTLDAADAMRPYSFEDLNDVKSQNSKIIGWNPSSALAWNDRCARQLDIYTLDKKLDGTPNPWSDLNLRKALSLLVDRTQLAKDGYKGTTTPSKTMFAEYRRCSRSSMKSLRLAMEPRRRRNRPRPLLQALATSETVWAIIITRRTAPFSALH